MFFIGLESQNSQDFETARSAAEGRAKRVKGRSFTENLLLLPTYLRPREARDGT